MFASVDIDIGAPQKYVTLPQTAVAYNPYGGTVYLVENKGKDANGQPKLVARQTFVTTGATRGDQVAILKGVEPGDTVVTAGQIKLRNGSPMHDQQRDPAEADDAESHPACRPVKAPAMKFTEFSSAGRCWRRRSA